MKACSRGREEYKKLYSSPLVTPLFTHIGRHYRMLDRDLSSKSTATSKFRLYYSRYEYYGSRSGICELCICDICERDLDLDLVDSVLWR